MAPQDIEQPSKPARTGFVLVAGGIGFLVVALPTTYRGFLEYGPTSAETPLPGFGLLFPLAIQVVIGGVLIALGLLSYALEWYRRK